jgi:hypothetical protein
VFNELPFELPVAGGLSQPNLFGRWVLCGEEIFHHACVAVALHNHDLNVWRGCFAEWNPIGRTFWITEAKDGALYKLDGVPVQQVYNRYLTDGNPVPFEHLYDFPLMKGEANGKKVYVPVRQLEDGGIEFDTHWQEGDEVRFCYNHPSLTEEQVRIGAKTCAAISRKVSSYTIAPRASTYIDDVNETGPFASAGSVNGVYCLGELYRDVNQQTIMHHSLTYLAMREHEIITNEVCEEKVTYQTSRFSAFFLNPQRCRRCG